MKLFVNKTEKEVTDNISVLAFMESQNAMQGSAIAVNGRLCLRKDWDNTFLKENDNVTLISAAFGG